MKRRLLPLFALVLMACPHGALKTDTPSSGRAGHDTPLLDVVPKDAAIAAVLRKGSMTLIDDFYALYPGLKEKFAALYTKRLGVDLSHAEGIAFFSLGGGADSFCSFLQVETPDALKGKPAGARGGVALIEYPKAKNAGAKKEAAREVMAAVKGGLLIGPVPAVEAAIDRIQGKTPRLSVHDALGQLRRADSEDTLVLVGVSKKVLMAKSALKNFAIKGATLSYDAKRRVVVRVAGETEQLTLLEKMLNGYLALQLQKLGERKEKALAKESTEVAAGAIMMHHLAVHYGKQLSPVVEGGHLVSRLQLPEGDQMMAAMVIGATAAVALPAFLSFRRLAQAAKKRSASPATGGADKAPGAAAAPSGPKAPIQLYIMSKCPYGVQAMDGFSGLLKKIGARVDLSIDYILTSKRGEPFKALHGPQEIKGNIVQLCARELYPRQSQWLPFFDCVNRTWRSIPDNWEQCAKAAQLDLPRLRGCIESPQGERLLKASDERAKQAGARGSPTIVIDGQRYSGGRGTSALLRAVCRKTQAPLPAACSALPKPVRVTVTVLTDKRCKQCKTAGLESNLRSRFFPALVVDTLDYNTKAGRRLYGTLRKNHKRLPIWIFGSEVEKAEKFDRIKRWMNKQRDGRYVLQVPAKFDPTAEICDNGVDDTKNGRIDCKDPTCKEKLLCRKEKKRQLQVFVMSQCPFAAKALLALREVKQVFGKRLRFDMHYIVSKAKKGEEGSGSRKPRFGFRALHGPSEVDENIRQLCAKKHYRRNEKYLDYVWCRMKDYRSDEWKGCAVNGIRASVIERCATGRQGRRLLARDMKQATALNITGSPTWLANNRFKFSGISAEAIKKSFCKHNPKTPGCEKTLSNKTDVKGSCGQ